MRLLVLELIALLISLLIIIIIFTAFVSYAEDEYRQQHPAIPIGEKDLGIAFPLIGATFASLFISIPLSILIHVFIFRMLFIRRKKDEW